MCYNMGARTDTWEGGVEEVAIKPQYTVALPIMQIVGVSAEPFHLVTSVGFFCLDSAVNELSAELAIAREMQEGRQKWAAEDRVRRVGSWQWLIGSSATAPKSEPFLEPRVMFFTQP